MATGTDVLNPFGPDELSGRGFSIRITLADFDVVFKAVLKEVIPATFANLITIESRHQTDVFEVQQSACECGGKESEHKQRVYPLVGVG